MTEVDYSDDAFDEALALAAGTLPLAVPTGSGEQAEALAPENDEGNVEYKLKLVNPTPERLQHLITQLKFRLAEGQGEAIYELGISDSGYPTGISPEEMVQSLETLGRMALELKADVSLVRERVGEKGKVAEVLVRRVAHEDFFEVRVAVVGNVDSGKSTLLGVLTKGVLDNGRGRARLNVFRHKHEVESGRTSCISQEILGFDSKGNTVNFKALNAGDNPNRHLSWNEICEHSSKIVSFIDLAGHERYLKTTIYGLTGHLPDFAMIVVGANAGVIGMAKEHLGIALALHVPVIVAVTKIDMCPPNVLKETMTQLKQLLKSPGARKIPLIVKNEDDVVVAARSFVSERIAPVFLMSSVTGHNVNLLLKFLNLLPTRADWEQSMAKPVEFYIDDIFQVPGAGTVVSGTLVSGVVSPNMTLLLGPDEFGNFQPAVVKSIHTKRVPVQRAHAGQTATFALKKIKRQQVRKGMVLLENPEEAKACWEFETDTLVLYHSTTISPNYQAMVHCNAARQVARIASMSSDVLRSRDKAVVRWRFLLYPEFLKEGSRMLFREGRTKGVGKVLRVFPVDPINPEPQQPLKSNNERQRRREHQDAPDQ